MYGVTCFCEEGGSFASGVGSQMIFELQVVKKQSLEGRTAAACVCKCAFFFSRKFEVWGLELIKVGHNWVTVNRKQVLPKEGGVEPRIYDKLYEEF